VVVGEDPETIGRDYGAQAFDGVLDEGVVPDNVEDLFGLSAAATGPEARSPPSRQNQPIIVLFWHEKHYFIGDGILDEVSACPLIPYLVRVRAQLR
jgi:hypothetical protein